MGFALLWYARGVSLITQGAYLFMRTLRSISSVFALAWFLPLAVQGQGAGRPDLPALFEKSEAMIAMRDGVKLHTELYSPRDAAEALPIVMVRTPYGISSPDHGISNMIYRYADM